MANILVVDDEKLILDMITIELEKQGFKVTATSSSKEAIKLLELAKYDLVLVDLMMPHITGLEMLQMIKERHPETPVIVITAYGSIETAVKAMKLGAYDYLTKPFSSDEFLIIVNKAIEFSKNQSELNYYRKENKFNYGLNAIVGISKEINEVKAMIKRVSSADVKVVLVEGESGVGKELIARAIHTEGRRSNKPFIAINCASLPENLLESELFGYEKGAFTDAKSSKEGLIEFADGGVLFLDEIGDMPMSLQAKLLRFLEDRTVRRLGGLEDIKLDVQLIAATNKNLKKLVKEEKFREDLYYRIKVVPIYVPPLRERKDDILELATFFINQFNKEFKKNIKSFSPIAKKMILLYDWPGNVRELKNTIERAMIFEDRDQIMVERLPLEIISASSRQPSDRSDIKLPETGIDIEEVERELLKQALAMAKGNQSKAARLLNIGVDAMRYRMKKFGFLSKDK